MTLATIESKALKLTLKERGQLAAKLIASLDEADPEEVNRMWMDEAQRRYQNLIAGRAKLVPARDVMARARKALRR
jgi:putative addiction module component (TIGR02574 family)